MLVAAAILLVVFALGSTLVIRRQALPAPLAESPTRHLEDKKATIYENLRDLQSEYLMGKLSDADYQKTKIDLQRELAGVLAEIESIDRLAQQGSSSMSMGAASTAKPSGGK